MNKKVDFNTYSKNYNDLLKQQHRKFGDISYYSQYKVNILKKYTPNNQSLKILEYGCGIGRNLTYLQKNYPNSDIYGFDISEDSIKTAKKENPKVIFIEEDSFHNLYNFFDIVFVAGVYHHIPLKVRDKVTKNIHSLLKNDSLCIIFEHNPFNPVTRHMVNTCEFDADAILLKKKELIKLFIDNQFLLKKSQYTLFLPPRLKFLNFIEDTIGWLPLGGQYYIVVQK